MYSIHDDRCVNPALYVLEMQNVGDLDLHYCWCGNGNGIPIRLHQLRCSETSFRKHLEDFTKCGDRSTIQLAMGVQMSSEYFNTTTLTILASGLILHRWKHRHYALQDTPRTLFLLWGYFTDNLKFTTGVLLGEFQSTVTSFATLKLNCKFWWNYNGMTCSCWFWQPC